MIINSVAWEELDEQEKEVLVQMAMIFSPVSLDVLFRTLSSAPTTTLKALEKFHKLGIIEPCKSKGTGFYSFRNKANASYILDQASEEQVVANAQILIEYYDNTCDEGSDKWLQIAHFYNIAPAQVRHASTVIKAAEYCMDNNKFKDAFDYFYLVLNNFSLPLTNKEEKLFYIKAAVGLCANSEDMLPLSIQECIVTQALTYIEEQDQDLNNLSLYVRTLIFKARCMMRQGDFEGADVFYSKALEITSNLDDPLLEKWISVYESDIQIWRGNIRNAIYAYEKLVGKLEEFPSNAFFLKACSRLGWSYGICGDIYRGLGLVNVVQKKGIELKIRYIEIYSELMKLMILTDTRRIPQARASLDILLSYPETELDHYVLWAVYGKKAYFEYLQDDLKAAYSAYQKSIMHSKALGCPHYHGTDHLEYLYAFEKAGLEEGVFQKKLDQFLVWPDIYTQGAALRYRAMYAMAENNLNINVSEDLEQSLELLKTAGANFELAQTQIQMARFLLAERSDEPRLRKLLKEAWDTISNVNGDLFPDGLKQYVEEDDSETHLVDTIVEVGDTLSKTRNRFELLSKMVKVIIRLVSAERCGIFLLDQEEKIKLESSRNLESATVNKNSFKLSSDIIQGVMKTGEKNISFGKFASLIITGQISENGWVVCHPIVLRGKAVGVLYLDNSFSVIQPPRHKLLLLKAIANQIAVALDNVDAYEKITRLRNRLEAETRFYRKENQKPELAGQIVGESPAIRKVLETIKEIAQSDATVLINGETGVGKELVARAIHSLSNRREGPFIPINIAAISPDLVYSELFGHTKGAFTGAILNHIGRFELANGGSFFMDDVDGLSLEFQVKLLRVLEEREFQKVGGSKTIKSDFRLIAATNNDLRLLVRKGEFRSDFYYRLNVVPITIPPLRNRKEDIPLLAEHFLGIYSRKMGKAVPKISSTNMDRLVDYSWPGNVRELSHYIERAVILGKGFFLKLPKHDPVASDQVSENLFLGLDEMLQKHIIDALNKCKWKVSGKNGAAALLKMKPQTLYSKIHKLNIKQIS